MVTKKKLGFIGVGNMGEALVKGLIASKAAAPAQILVSARRRERIDELEKLYGVRGGSNSEVARDSDVVVLAVKPQILDQVLRGISGDVSRDKLIVSVAAGVPIAAIERRLHPPMRIVRAMPNTPATVGAGATAIALGEHATEADLATAKTIFDSVGLTVLLDESGQHPGLLKDGVTSPGGTAIAGLHTLEAGGLRNVLMNAVEAATRRSRELGEEFLRKL